MRKRSQLLYSSTESSVMAAQYVTNHANHATTTNTTVTITTTSTTTG